MRAALLIAEREFKTYTTTVSFWVALVVAPLLLAGGAFVAAQGGSEIAPAATMKLARGADGAMTAQFSEAFPLGAEGRAKLARLVAEEGVGEPVKVAAAEAKAKTDPAAASRFALIMMLWMTLTGSLGMLLQAVVRERSNRALESLMAAARPFDIVMGKLIGVGAVSLVVLGAWFASALALGALNPGASDAIAQLLHGLADPLALARAMLIYVLAFGFYGLLTVAAGTRARDNADAQNLARPMFALLLAVFFTTLAANHSAGALGWLIYAPPFAPFMLLATQHSPAEEALALALLALAAVGAAVLATKGLRLSPARSWFKSA
ncbi:ABC transporter permease [Phenylobacterium sp.]|uniref:ABC transporter permease n=1 Tax=Phenylobacterium sp. TaxID=1871053 RepID=UPI0035B09671